MIRNLDYDCYLHEITTQRDHQEDWIRSGYAPRGFYLKDFCIIRAREAWHLFHIAGTPGVSCCLPGNETWFGHAETRDFQTWLTHEPCFIIDTNSWDSGHVFSPFVLEHNGLFWMSYTGTTPDNTQRIGAAWSDDLFRWRRAAPHPVIRPDEYDWAFCPVTKGAACRDPHVCEIDGRFQMYYTAVTKEGRGCVARASSTNLLDWRDEGPAYVAPELSHCESSNVQRLGDRYLLFFGGHYEYWSYVVSDNPLHWPQQDPIPLKRHITAMEVIVRRDPRWLVSYFKFDNYRMFLGVIDWSHPQPTIEEIQEFSQLAEFGIPQP